MLVVGATVAVVVGATVVDVVACGVVVSGAWVVEGVRVVVDSGTVEVVVLVVVVVS